MNRHYAYTVVYLWAGLFILGCGCSPVSPDSSTPKALGPAKDLSGPTSKQHVKACRPKNAKLAQESCDSGFICVPLGIDKKEGLCLKDCGLVEASYLKKNEEACPHDLRCMLLKDHELNSLGMFCLKPQSLKSERCLAPFDDYACANNLSCLPMASYQDISGKTFYGLFRCEAECGTHKACMDPAEICSYEHGRIEKQKANNGIKKHQPCSILRCQDSHYPCPCNKEQGFFCGPLMPGIDQGVCLKKLGVCIK